MKATVRCSLALGALASACLASCTSEVSPSATEVSQREQLIAGGSEDTGESSTVLVEGSQDDVSSICSGVLLLPDLVLTAAHCLTGLAGPVDCTTTTIPPALAPPAFRVSAGPNLAGSLDPDFPFVGVSTVRLVTEPGAPFCGNDLAFLALDAPLEHIAVAEARLSESPRANTRITAVGYGAQHASGTGERVRRLRELTVICRGAACDDVELSGVAGAAAFAAPPVEPNEFLASEGPCPGDSGGPAFEGSELVGILSRGLEGCQAPIFVGIDERVAAAVREHASATAQPLPKWATQATSGDGSEQAAGAAGDGAGTNTDDDHDGSSDDGDGESSGCTMGPNNRRQSGGPWFAVSLLGLATLFFRRTAGATSRRRGLRGSRLAIVGSCLGLIGCTSEVLDTEGRRFSVECENRSCRLTELEKPDGKVLSAAVDGRLLRACEGASPHDPRTCRALACEADSDCRIFESNRFSCTNGLCQATERSVSEDDRLALCLAGTGKWSATIDQRRRTLLARSCAPPCSVPSQCRQP